MREKNNNSVLLKPLSFSRLIFYFTGFLFFSFQSGRDELLWQENKPLTWADFKGVPEKRFAVASTHYDILKSVSAENDSGAIVKIRAVFFRNESWRKKEWINDDVLIHEQKHFDIVELFARKIRKAIKGTTFQNYNDLIKKTNEIYRKYDKEMDSFQDLYDKETDSSMNGKEQRKWNAKISSGLKDMDNYKDNEIEVSF